MECGQSDFVLFAEGAENAQLGEKTRIEDCVIAHDMRREEEVRIQQHVPAPCAEKKLAQRQQCRIQLEFVDVRPLLGR